MIYRVLPVWLVLLAACEPDLDFVQWDPLEPEEVQQALTEPTASIDQLLEPEHLQAIADRLPLLVEHTRLTARLIDAIDEASEPTQADAGDADGSGSDSASWEEGQGTAYYLGMGCPGGGAEPDYDESHGTVRLDSEKLDSPEPQLVRGGGSVLLTFEHCQLGAVTVDGRAPAALRLARDVIDPAAVLPVPQGAFGMAVDLGDLQAQGTDSAVGVAAFLCSGFGGCSTQQQVQAELRGGDLGTVVIGLALDRNYWNAPVSLRVALRTANGTASCEYVRAGRSLDCSRD